MCTPLFSWSHQIQWRRRMASFFFDQQPSPRHLSACIGIIGCWINSASCTYGETGLNRARLPWTTLFICQVWINSSSALWVWAVSLQVRAGSQCLYIFLIAFNAYPRGSCCALPQAVSDSDHSCAVRHVNFVLASVTTSEPFFDTSTLKSHLVMVVSLQLHQLLRVPHRRWELHLRLLLQSGVIKLEQLNVIFILLLFTEYPLIGWTGLWNLYSTILGFDELIKLIQWLALLEIIHKSLTVIDFVGGILIIDIGMRDSVFMIVSQPMPQLIL